jgi:hypothetical protein
MGLPMSQLANRLTLAVGRLLPVRPEMVLGQAAELHVELVDVVVHELEEVGAA